MVSLHVTRIHNDSENCLNSKRNFKQNLGVQAIKAGTESPKPWEISIFSWHVGGQVTRSSRTRKLRKHQRLIELLVRNEGCEALSLAVRLHWRKPINARKIVCNNN
jgi:hypothetical protein